MAPSVASSSECLPCRAGLSLLDKMLQVDPKERIDIAGILGHPWFGTSMKDEALSVNQGLLEMPDSMLTGRPMPLRPAPP